MRLPLRAVQVKNFKSIKDSGSVRLTPLTVLIGYNGSGKSSLIEGLQTFQDLLTRGLDEAMQPYLGFDHIWSKNARHNPRTKDGRITYENPMSFQLRGQLQSGSFQARLDVNAEEGFNGVCIEMEEYKYSRDRKISRDASGTIRDSESEQEERVGPGESAAPSAIRSFVNSWQFLTLRPYTMGTPFPQRMAQGQSILNPDGSNVAQYLWHIRETDPNAFEGIIETLAYVLPYAQDIQPSITQEIQRTVYLQLVQEEFKIPGWLLSTGTLRILALIAVLRNPDPAPVIIIEEIENGLDPRTINLIVEEIQTYVEEERGQVVLTTHSPYLLDKLRVQDIVLVERNNGETVFGRPADEESVRKWAEEFSPGKLYTMNRLTTGA